MVERRTTGRIALTVLFTLLALNAWTQAVLVPLGRSGDPPVLIALQVLIGGLAAAVAWGSWSGAQWAPAAAVAYGVVTAGMLLSLGPLLRLRADARGGLWMGAAIILLCSLASAWYLRRAVARSSNSPRDVR